MKKNWKIAGIIATLTIVLLIPLYVFMHLSEETKVKTDEGAVFVGSNSCVECHKAAYDDWRISDHYFAMDTASSGSVFGDFNNATLVRNGDTSRFYKKGGQYFVYTDGPDGTMQEFEVKYTFGAWPLQQYLVPLSGGRLQTLALTWDTITKKWYHMADSVYADETVDHTDWLHWTNQGQNWNGMCADCHSTNLKKGFDPETKTYHTTWSEINVGCEACHGPSSEHLKWANLPELARPEGTNFGLEVKTSNIDNRQYVDQCARCHARRSIFSDYDFTWHNLLDQMIPELPREPFYYSDGQILEEDYVFGSFTQSKMYMNDVQCNDCHNVHSGKLILDGNALCLQCHRADEYDTYTHHFHKQAGEKGEPVVSVFGDTYEVGEGAQCINCHMPGRYYMGVDFRRDHSFRIPRPDLSDELGTPNACTTCHGDKSNQWAAGKIKEWYGDVSRQHYGSYLALTAREKENTGKFAYIINDDLFPPITQATAISLMAEQYPESNSTILNDELHNPEAILRYTAVRNFAIVDSADVLTLIRLLNDPVKAIRTEAAMKLSVIPQDQIPEKNRDSFKKALKEYEEAQLYMADFAAARHNLGNLYNNLGETEKAIGQYRDAIQIDNLFYPAKINLSMLYNQEGKKEEAEKLLKEVLKEHPDQYYVNYSLGLLLAEMKKYDEALTYLETAANEMKDNLRVYYNLAQLQIFLGQDKEAEKNLRYMVQKKPESPEYLMALIDFYISHEQYEKARAYILKLDKIFPEDPQAKQLLDFVESKLL